MELSDLTYPRLREELIETMKSLSDRDYQRRVWIDKQYPHENFYDDLTTTVNIFHDLINDDDFYQYIGAFLLNRAEADSIERVYFAVDTVINALHDSPDGTYVSDPRWDGVIAAAAHAHAELTKPGQ